MPKVLFLLLLIALATSFNVYKNKEGTKCYVDAKLNDEKGQTIYLDMSDYLDKDKYLMFILDECFGYEEANVNGTLPVTDCFTKMAPGNPGVSTAFYLNGKNMALFLNPCVEFSVVPNFTIDGVEHVSVDDRTCKSVATSEETASNGCIGIFGQIALGMQNIVNSTVPLKGTLRALKKEVLRGAKIIYNEDIPSEPGTSYSRYTLSFLAETKIGDMVPYMTLPSPDLQNLLDNCYNYAINVTFDGFTDYTYNGQKSSHIIVDNAEDASAENAHGSIIIKYQMHYAPESGFEYQTNKPNVDAGYKSTFVASLLALLVIFGVLI